MNVRLEPCAVVRMNPREELAASESVLWIRTQDLRSVLAALRQAGARIPLERHHRAGGQRFLQPRLAFFAYSFVLTPLGKQRRQNVCAQRDTQDRRLGADDAIADRKGRIPEMSDAESYRPD